jgi:hypothetical protein
MDHYTTSNRHEREVTEKPTSEHLKLDDIPMDPEPAHGKLVPNAPAMSMADDTSMETLKILKSNHTYKNL